MRFLVIYAAVLCFAPAIVFAQPLPMLEPSGFVLLSVGAAVAVLVAWKRKAT